MYNALPSFCLLIICTALLYSKMTVCIIFRCRRRSGWGLECRQSRMEETVHLSIKVQQFWDICRSEKTTSVSRLHILKILNSTVRCNTMWPKINNYLSVCRQTTLIHLGSDDKEIASVYYVSSSFKPRGMLETSVAEQAANYLEDEMKHTQPKKKIICFRLSVSTKRLL